MASITDTAGNIYTNSGMQIQPDQWVDGSTGQPIKIMPHKIRMRFDYKDSVTRFSTDSSVSNHPMVYPATWAVVTVDGKRTKSYTVTVPDDEYTPLDIIYFVGLNYSRTGTSQLYSMLLTLNDHDALDALNEGTSDGEGDTLLSA